MLNNIHRQVKAVSLAKTLLSLRKQGKQLTPLAENQHLQHDPKSGTHHI